VSILLYIFIIIPIKREEIVLDHNFIETNYDQYGVWVENYTKENVDIGRGIGITLCCLCGIISCRWFGQTVKGGEELKALSEKLTQL